MSNAKEAKAKTSTTKVSTESPKKTTTAKARRSVKPKGKPTSMGRTAKSSKGADNVSDSIVANNDTLNTEIVTKVRHTHNGVSYEKGTLLSEIKGLTNGDIVYMRSCGTI